MVTANLPDRIGAPWGGGSIPPGRSAGSGIIRRRAPAWRRVRPPSGWLRSGNRLRQDDHLGPQLASCAPKIADGVGGAVINGHDRPCHSLRAPVLPQRTLRLPPRYRHALALGPRRLLHAPGQTTAYPAVPLRALRALLLRADLQRRLLAPAPRAPLGDLPCPHPLHRLSPARPQARLLAPDDRAPGRPPRPP